MYINDSYIELVRPILVHVQGTLGHSQRTEYSHVYMYMYMVEYMDLYSTHSHNGQFSG